MKYFISIAILLVFLHSTSDAQKKHKGIRAEDSFTGITEDKDNKIVKIIIIHGTGCKPETYSKSLIEHLSKNLHLTEENGYKSDNVRFSFGLVSFKVFEFKPSDNLKQTYQFYSIHWSKLTALQKLDLLNEDKPQVPRGLLAGYVKKNILIEQLSDFLLYNNDSIKKYMFTSSALFVRRILFLDNPCDFKQYSETLLTKNISPLDLNPKVDISVNVSKLYIISGSLGSSILYDIYNQKDDDDEWSRYLSHHITNKELYNEAVRKLNNQQTKLFKSSVQTDYISTRLIFASKKIVHYALTNQFNLIGLQDQSYLDIARDDPDFLFKNLEIIAFGDPSDVLSYYVPHYKFERQGVTVNNVVLRIKKPWNLFSKAHTLAFYNKKLHKVIAEGYTVKQKQKKEISGCERCKNKKCKKIEEGKKKKSLPCQCWEEEFY